MTEHELREHLAAYAHEAWAGWMRYLLSKCEARGDGLLIPNAYVAALLRQIQTPYAELSEAEKNSDRTEADTMIVLMKGLPSPTPCEGCAGLGTYDGHALYPDEFAPGERGICECCGGTG